MSKEEYRFQFNKNIIVTLSDERLITPSGLCMVGQIFGKSSLAKKAAEIRAEYKNFKTMDCLQIASACVMGCDLFFTNDNQLRQFREIKCMTVEDFMQKK